jgi:hypothetical protein
MNDLNSAVTDDDTTRRRLCHVAFVLVPAPGDGDSRRPFCSAETLFAGHVAVASRVFCGILVQALPAHCLVLGRVGDCAFDTVCTQPLYPYALPLSSQFVSFECTMADLMLDAEQVRSQWLRWHGRRVRRRLCVSCPAA